MTLETIIDSFESKAIDVYKFLDQFVSFLEKKIKRRIFPSLLSTST
jgi:hypothetical protein